MLKRIIILGLIILGAIVFYNEFMAGTMEPFFKKKAGNVDLLGVKNTDYKVEE